MLLSCILWFLFGSIVGVAIMCIVQINRFKEFDKIREHNEMLKVELEYRKERYQDYKDKSMKLIKQKDKKITQLKSEIEQYKKCLYSGNHIPRID